MHKFLLFLLSFLVATIFSKNCSGQCATGTITTPFTYYCSSGSPVLTLNGHTTGATIQWQVSTTSTSGPWTNVGTNADTYTPTVTQRSYFTAVVSCGATSLNANVITIYTGLLTAGILTASNCGTNSPLLALNGYSGGATIQWRQAPSMSGPWTNVGANSATYSPTVTQPTYFIAMVSCSGAIFSNIVLAGTGIVGGNISTTSANYCSSGNAHLSLNGNSAGATIQWQESTTSASGPWTNVGTNSPYYNTTMNTTTFFQAQVTCGVTTATTSVATITVSNVPPGNRATTITSLTNANISWSQVNGASGYNYRYRIVGAPSWTTGANVGLGNVSVALAGLTTGAYYEWQVQTVCGGSATSSFSASEFFLATFNCVTASVITSGTLYTFNPPIGTGAWTSSCSNSGNNSGVETVYSFTPSVSGYHLMFFPAATSNTNYSAFDYKAASIGCNSLNWTCIGPPGSNVRQYSFGPLTAGVQYYIMGDVFDKSVAPIPTVFRIEAPNCLQPYSVAMVSSTQNRITLSWNGSSPNGTLIEYGLPGFIPGTGATPGIGGTVVLLSGTTGDITGLASNTTYDIYARNNCGASLYSPNSSWISASTQAGCTASIAGSTTFCAGSGNILTANTGSGITYQWYRNTVLQNGATSSTFNANSNGTYYVVESSSCGTAQSNSIVVTQINNPNATISYTTPLSFCAPGSVVLTSSTFSGVSYQWQKNSVDIAGATSQNYSATSNGTYRVRQTANGCFKYSPAVSVTTAASVTATITANGPVTFCTGGSVVLSVSNAVPGYGYQWKNNGVNISNATSSSYTATTPGSFTCSVTANCGTTTSNAIVVSTGGITASVNPSGPVSICSGAVAALSANTGTNYTFQWKRNGTNITGATNSTYGATIAGSYTVAITSPCGNATSVATTVSIGNVTASISPSGSATICAGSAQTFTANTGYNFVYQWFRNGVALAGATSSTYATSNYGSYTVRVTQGGVCSATSAASVLSVTNNSTPTVTPQGPTTFCAGQSVVLQANTFAGVVFQWQKNGIDIAGATNQNYTATTAGSYRVKQTANGCTKSSATVSVTVNCRVADDQLPSKSEKLVVRPNPFTNELEVAGDFNAGDEIELVDLLGNTIMKYTITQPTKNTKLETHNIKPGVYFLQVLAGNERKTVKVVRGII